MKFVESIDRRSALQQLSAVVTCLGMSHFVMANDVLSPVHKNQREHGSIPLCRDAMQVCTATGQQVLEYSKSIQDDVDSIWHMVRDHDYISLNKQIAQDFAMNNTTLVDGWVLSKTEAALFALTALLAQT